jgi:hypothetical protein
MAACSRRPGRCSPAQRSSTVSNCSAPPISAGGPGAEAASPRQVSSRDLRYLVGGTGFEPVTFSVSGRRAPAAPTARDDESLPDPWGAPAALTTSRPGAVQVRTGQLVLALDQTERGVARQAQQPANTRAAGGLLIQAAGMVMVDEDRQLVLERGVRGSWAARAADPAY